MTVAVASPINTYIGNGTSNTFSFTFPIFVQSQLTVTANGTAGVFTLALGTDYTVSGLNASGDPASTGNIVLVNSGQAWLLAGNLATGYTLNITRNLPIAQNTSIRNQGDFYRSSLEDALDYIVMLLQDIELSQSGADIVLTDIVTGATYQLLVANGVLSLQELT